MKVKEEEKEEKAPYLTRKLRIVFFCVWRKQKTSKQEIGKRNCGRVKESNVEASGESGELEGGRGGSSLHP